LSDLAIRASHLCVQIPMAGIVLYEVARQRREYLRRKVEAREAKAFVELRGASANGLI